jgi:hypothetical protein
VRTIKQERPFWLCEEKPLANFAPGRGQTGAAPRSRSRSHAWPHGFRRRIAFFILFFIFIFIFIFAKNKYIFL